MLSAFYLAKSVGLSRVRTTSKVLSARDWSTLVVGPVGNESIHTHREFHADYTTEITCGENATATEVDG